MYERVFDSVFFSLVFAAHTLIEFAVMNVSFFFFLRWNVFFFFLLLAAGERAVVVANSLVGKTFVL